MIAGLLLATVCTCNKPVSLKKEVCTVENVVKALELSKQFLPESNNLYVTEGTIGDGGLTAPIWLGRANVLPLTKPGTPKRVEAQKLIEEANKLDQQAEDAALIRKILKACKED